MDFSRLQHTIFDRPVFWPAVLQPSVSLGISNQEMLFLVRSIFRKLDPGQSLPWQALGFEVKTVKEA